MRFVQEMPKQFQSKDSPNSAKAQFMKAIKRGSKKPGDLDPQERYNEIYKEKVKEMKNKAMKGAKYTFNLPGTDPTQAQQLSKGAQEIIQKIAEKQAKREEKRLKKADKIKIIPKHFTGGQGGRIDTRGHVFDSAGQWIMTVDKKSGKIKHRNGNTVGKYNPGCNYSEHRLCELISNYDTTKNAGWYAGTQGHASSTVGGIYGSGGGWGAESNSCGGGSIWGNHESHSGGGKDIWGNGSSDKQGWW